MTLDECGLHVHSYVEHPRARAEQEHRDQGRRVGPGECGDQKGGDGQSAGGVEDGTGTDAIAQPTGYGHDGDGTDCGGEQEPGEPSLAESELFGQTG